MYDPHKSIGPRRALAALALAAGLAACTSYVFPPADVAYEKLSPPYVVALVNDTGSSFAVLPSSSGARAGRGAVLVAPGATFEAILQLRRFAGEASAQLVDNPYFEQPRPGAAALRLVQIEEHALSIDLRDPSWFEPYRRPQAAPLELRVVLHELPGEPLFAGGPRAAP